MTIVIERFYQVCLQGTLKSSIQYQTDRIQIPSLTYSDFDAFDLNQHINRQSKRPVLIGNQGTT